MKYQKIEKKNKMNKYKFFKILNEVYLNLMIKRINVIH